ncbi:hypothetical protein [uncultured Psychroserpens sp.]|uniref:hypothetical protein n=1 Tax=uncultured Psychroserpens sp. TaxID=255436 RepID=UPI0026093500|nr:hypothetical protein [uncultured Psychroserpens sp.]
MKTMLRIVCIILFLSVSHSGLGQTKKICSTQNIPEGWVITGIEYCSCCGAAPTYKRFRYTIKKISTMKVGSKVAICSKKNIPNGWVIVGKTNCSCCGARPTYRKTRWTIERID